MEDLRNGHNTAIPSALSPSRMCGRLKDSVHGWPWWVAPIKHHPESRTTEGSERVRRYDTIAAPFLVI
jgi:hypothetical protein